MRQILDVLPDAELPDPTSESAAPGVDLLAADDDDLLRPLAEEELLRVGDHGSLAGRGNAPLAKHLVWSFGPLGAVGTLVGSPRGGPLLLRVEIDGDRLVTVEPEIGFAHQGVEKRCESVPYAELFGVVARAHPSASLAIELCTALAVERLLGIAEQVPARAQVWRTVALEALRIVEHIRALRAPALGLERRLLGPEVQDAQRAVAGILNGLQQGGTFRRLGGLARDIHDDEAGSILRTLPRALQPLSAAVVRLGHNDSLDEHLEGIGRIAAERAILRGLTGPALRACGVRDDCRTEDPAFAWPQHPPRVVTQTAGCARARCRVRLHEIAASAELIERALTTLSAHGDSVALPLAPTPLRPEAGLGTASVEAPGGEVMVMVMSDGSERPLRVRLRTSSLSLVAALPVLLEGCRLDDAGAALASLDVSVTEIDR